MFDGDDNRIARDCLKYFSDQFGKIYGRNHLIYNVHSIIHLADDCLTHGPLDRFSCFPFETYLGRLKRLIRSSNRPLAQMVRRISELDHVASFDQDISPSIFNKRDTERTLLNELRVGTRSDSYYLTNKNTIVKVITIFPFNSTPLFTPIFTFQIY